MAVRRGHGVGCCLVASLPTKLRLAACNLLCTLFDGASPAACADLDVLLLKRATAQSFAAAGIAGVAGASASEAAGGLLAGL